MSIKSLLARYCLSGIQPLPIQLYRTQFADAAIKTLPTTPVTLVPAQGAGIFILPVMTVLLSNFTAGYTNINATLAFLNAYWTGAAGSFFSDYLAKDSSSTPALTYTNDFLTATNPNYQYLRPFLDTVDVAADWGGLPVPGEIKLNAAYLLAMDNNGSGNLTGGNAANTLTAYTSYYLLRP